MKIYSLLIISFFTSVAYCQNLNLGLVGHYTFDNGLNDQSTYNFTGMNFGATPAPGINNQPNTAYYLDGNDYIELGTNNRSITNRITVSFWVKTTSMNYMHPFEKYNYTQDKGYHTFINYGRVNTAGRDGSSNYQNTGPSSINIADGQWHHVVSIVDSNEWKTYVDCKLESYSYSSTQNPYLASSAQMTIGRYRQDNVGYLVGSIDELRIYNRVLTLAEMDMICSKEAGIIEENLPKLTLFPNPADEQISIDVSENGTMNLVSSTGEILITKELMIGTNEFKLTNYKPGVYFIQYNTNKQMQTIKFVIQ